MINVSIKKTDHLLNEKLMTPEFRRGFQGEYAKVLLTQKIAEIRKKCHIDQKTLAYRLGVSQQVVSRIETGANNNLTIDTLSQFAQALEHTVRISFHKTSGKGASLEIA